VHAAAPYHEQPATTQAALVVLTEQAPGMPEQDPLTVPQSHPCTARQVPRFTLPRQALDAVMQTALLHVHPICAEHAAWLKFSLHGSGVAKQVPPSGGGVQVQPGCPAQSAASERLSQGEGVPEQDPGGSQTQPGFAAQVVDVELLLQDAGLPRQWLKPEYGDI